MTASNAGSRAFAARLAALDFYDGEPPALGGAVEIAEGILWTRIPLPMPKLPIVNLYALDEGDGWTLIDTGLAWADGRAALTAFLEGPLGGKPVTRVIATHHHPDHIGLVGDLAARGAEVWITRLAYFMGRMLTLDVQERPPEEALLFRRRGGMPADKLAAFAEERPMNFADRVAPVPLAFRAVEEGDWIEAGGRRWQVRLGQGHAPDHITLWSEDGSLLLAGDQILPGISPNIGTYPTEPDADPLGGFLTTCARFEALAEAGADPLILPGHQRPFRGARHPLPLADRGSCPGARAHGGGDGRGPAHRHRALRRDLPPADLGCRVRARLRRGGLALQPPLAHRARRPHPRPGRRLALQPRGGPMTDLPMKPEARPDARAVRTDCDEGDCAENQPLPKAIAEGQAKQKSPAEWAYMRLALYLKKFEEQLDAEHEVGLGIAGSEAGRAAHPGRGVFRAGSHHLLRARPARGEDPADPACEPAQRDAEGGAQADRHCRAHRLPSREPHRGGRGRGR